jgi:hypothetical protein
MIAGFYTATSSLRYVYVQASHNLFQKSVLKVTRLPVSEFAGEPIKIRQCSKSCIFLNCWDMDEVKLWALEVK